MLRKLTTSITFLFICLAIHGQETDYTELYIDIQQPPTLTQYADYKTFDLTVLTSREQQDKPGTGFNLGFKVKAGTLNQVTEGGDFHVVSFLQRYNGKMNSPSTADVNVALNSTVYDRYGNVVKTGAVNNEHFAVNFGKTLSKEESANQDYIRGFIMERVIEASLQPLVDGINGAKQRPAIRIASLDDVKKKPELQAFDDQVKILKPVLEKEKLPGFKISAEPFLSYWEKMSNYSGDGDKDEVKRAALHNLALYHIAAGNYDKAREYIEPYKAIDKQIKQMFGLIKYKNSEELEKLITIISPAATAEAAAPVTGNKLLSMAEVAENHQFLIINGTARISGKRDEGTYKGLIKVYKLPSNSFGNVVSLDPENIRVVINTTDASGQPKTINTTVSKIEELKDDNGTAYTTQKFGTSVLGDGSYYVFMMSSYTSPKVTVFRAIIPAGGEWVVKKPGDDKGVKSSLLGARKNLEEYLADCAGLAAKFKDGSIDKKAAIEKIAEEYSKCQ